MTHKWPVTSLLERRRRFNYLHSISCRSTLSYIFCSRISPLWSQWRSTSFHAPLAHHHHHHLPHQHLILTLIYPPLAITFCRSIPLSAFGCSSCFLLSQLRPSLHSTPAAFICSHKSWTQSTGRYTCNYIFAPLPLWLRCSYSTCRRWGRWGWGHQLPRGCSCCAQTLKTMLVGEHCGCSPVMLTGTWLTSAGLWQAVLQLLITINDLIRDARVLSRLPPASAHHTVVRKGPLESRSSS